MKRDFAAEGRDRLWVADITYIPTGSGFPYLAVVVDAWSRRVVGWSMAIHLRPELVLEALTTALGQRRPLEVIQDYAPACWRSRIPRGRYRPAGATDREATSAASIAGGSAAPQGPGLRSVTAFR